MATRTSAALGFSRHDIMDIIQTMRPPQFYKSMTSHGNHRIWQDIYHVPSEIGTLYVKFTVDAVTEFVLLSFKGKDNESLR
jgi:motility quorum-sensing regulator/GCU-specific mRNA interferase toxin